MGWKFHQRDGGLIVCDGINTTAYTGTRAAVSGLSAKHVAFGPFVQTTLTSTTWRRRSWTARSIRGRSCSRSLKRGCGSLARWQR
jgi:hypothetical protein